MSKLIKSKSIFIILGCLVFLFLGSVVYTYADITEQGVEKHTVKFETIDGVTEIQVDHNSTILKPADPIKEGLTFKGWLNGKTSTYWNFETDAVTEDITLYAVLVGVQDAPPVISMPDTTNGQKHTVKFETTEGVTEIQVDHNSAVPKPVDPVKEGFTFHGWINMKTGTGWNFETDLVTEDITLGTAFSASQEAPPTISMPDTTNGEKHTVRFETTEGVTEIQVDHNSTVPKPTDPVKEGFTFHGWINMKTGTGWNFETDLVTEDITLGTAFSASQEAPPTISMPDTTNEQKHTVKFWTMDGINEIQVDHNSTIPKPADPTKEGLEFKGWINPKTSTLWNFEKDVVTEDVTLAALLVGVKPAPPSISMPNKNAQKYTVKFKSEKGTSKIFVNNNSTIIKPVDPIKRGYTFQGWLNTRTNTYWNFERDVVRNDITLTAKFTRNTEKK